jgi:hypothetical protein
MLENHSPGFLGISRKLRTPTLDATSFELRTRFETIATSVTQAILSCGAATVIVTVLNMLARSTPRFGLFQPFESSSQWVSPLLCMVYFAAGCGLNCPLPLRPAP